jgi:hypothetical protein
LYLNHCQATHAGLNQVRREISIKGGAVGLRVDVSAGAIFIGEATVLGLRVNFGHQHRPSLEFKIRSMTSLGDQSGRRAWADQRA